MKFIFLFLLNALLLSPAEWGTDFEKAKQTAALEHKFILLNFSGSDWCGPCIRLHDEIFGSRVFKDFAAANLVLVNADFPRQKKNQLTKELQNQNDQLADIYNADGSFPLTVLLTPGGKVIKKWDGYPPVSPEEFVVQLKTAVDAAK
jgi:thioredoxin-related protein